MFEVVRPYIGPADVGAVDNTGTGAGASVPIGEAPDDGGPAMNHAINPPDFAMTIAATRDLKADLAEAVRFGEGSGPFGQLSEQLRKATIAAYASYLHIRANRRQALAEIRKLPPYDKRQRAPKGDEATISLTLATLPRDKRECGAVSEYSSFMILAERDKVPPADYAAWLETAPSLKEVLRRVRVQRAKPKKDSPHQIEPTATEVASDAADEMSHIPEGGAQQAAMSGGPSLGPKRTNFMTIAVTTRAAQGGVISYDLHLSEPNAFLLASRLKNAAPQDKAMMIVKFLIFKMRREQRSQLATALRRGKGVGSPKRARKNADGSLTASLNLQPADRRLPKVPTVDVRPSA